MTSTAAGLAFYNHVIPLVSKFVKTSKTHVTLSRTVPSSQDITEKCKFSVPLLSNHDVETICRCILEFCDVCHATRLSLTQGPLKFTYFRQCLDGITRSTSYCQHPTLFDGKLKLFVGPKVHLELVDNPVPSRRKPYPIPKSQLHVFKQELERLINIGVLEKAQRSEWIAGTFIVPKKDGRVCWITDFRSLNKSLRRRVYPQRTINEIFA